MKVALYACVSRHDKDQTPETQLVTLTEYGFESRFKLVPGIVEGYLRTLPELFAEPPNEVKGHDEAT